MTQTIITSSIGTTSPPTYSPLTTASIRNTILAYKRAATASQNAKAARSIIWAALPRTSPLREKMMRCGNRELSYGLVKRYDCMRPSCPVCMRRKGLKFFKDIVWPALERTSINNLRWTTVITHVVTNLDDGFEQSKVHHRALRRIIGGINGGKNKIRLYGAREVEIVRPSDWLSWSQTKRDLLKHLAFPTNHAGPVYVIHWHMIIDTDGRDGVLEQALRSKWSGPRQVQLKKFIATNSLETNLRNLSCYPVKARMTRDVGHDRREWLSDQEISHYAQWSYWISPRWFRFNMGTR